MTRLTQKSSEEARMQIYWVNCIDNMYNKIKENNLTDEFLSIDLESTGFMFIDSPIVREIDILTNNDGHSGSSFACCCRIVYETLQDEKEKKEIQRLKAQFRGVVKAIIKLKKLRLKAAENVYSPGSIGFLLAQKEFNYYISPPPPPPTTIFIK